MNIGIVGMGIIGKAVQRLFPDAIGVDKYDDHRILNDFDFVFVCVPTPCCGDGLDMSIVREVVNEIGDGPVIIICSALQPGTADSLNGNIVVQPEYFGESVAHPLTKLSEQQFLILGGEKENVDKVVELYKSVYNANIKIRKVTALEAEVIKLSENRAIAFKVAQCQELYDACIRNGIDYDTIREAVYGDDPRFNLWWTFIYKDKRGFNSKCLPKDVYGWQRWANGSDITDAVLRKNEEWIKSQY